MLEIRDKNGNRRAYARDEDDAERELERLNKEKPNMAPFKVQEVPAETSADPEE